MRVEVITTGTELLLGEIVNENFVYLAQELNSRGFDVLYQTTVGTIRSGFAKRCGLPQAGLISL
jgi:nicotinamide-nucleotide amidase